ncbi:MAG TPA: CDP-alcohol phosphatidyltransferase family protein [Jiangellaceae bacterium]|jgi:cardiolipin synthase|nr:CDP-alcohol phosphatidyltransferase family protein [Jiangellaceae bacterium]
MEVQDTEVQTNRVFTVPNLLSFLRLLGVPLFLWLVLVREADGWAFLVLAVSAFTDYLDGKLARRWHQISRVGQILDPLADRLYIFSTVVALTLREIVPLWFAVLLVGRDVFLAFLVPALRRRGLTVLPVHFLGKAATLCLLCGLPLLLLGDGDGTLALLARVFGWAFAVWGVGLYWWAGLIYAEQVRRLLPVA